MSKVEAELRRTNEELTNAYRQLEEQNQKLREQLRGPQPKKPAPKPETPPGAGSLVVYVDKAGHTHNALVLEVLEDNMLRLKIFRQATPNVVLDARRGQDDKQRSCWRKK